ncbi:hypothetical protein BDV27DRAFT_161821 [Aspergillus caelatus]|uniref:N-acetyltransferase domain-containing protein n=2 Tax=Aspergillus subgen. Circumdati TaxID=2720871 RepID=A0A5N6ZRU3_9EURO|nr:uncharacterized protein BDV27DRAFT_161821 [Aspergillus caelatus]KAE8360294.1 hypothetical protein BDV27DRAFT_161821 [Aspergillus caelatus]KAE8421415.1 hypothetical protein BDV36DRAFT_292341 [Aspergillus pseudocaelatus]
MTITQPQLSNRYQIRPLTLSHLTWTKALLVQANTSPSSIWPTLQPGNQTALAYRQFHAMDSLVRHLINSGISFGVFDTEYQFRFPSSAETGGQLYWDETDLKATTEQLLEQMDFPLVSIALSYDATDPPDEAKLQDYYDSLPVARDMFSHLESLIPPSARAGYASAGCGKLRRGKVLMARSLATRGDYERRGIMKGTAWWLMREAKRWGYEVIEIRTGSAAVRRVWENPPEPFRATVMAEFVVGEYEVVDAEGRKRRPFQGINAERCRLRIDL